MKKINIKENKNNLNYEVKRGRGPQNFIVVSPFDWEENRRFTDKNSAHFWAENKNVALANERRAKAKLAISS